MIGNQQKANLMADAPHMMRQRLSVGRAQINDGNFGESRAHI
jgi:hypothetical protein